MSSGNVWPRKRRCDRPASDLGVLRLQGAEVEVLVEHDGRRQWWRGVVLRAADDARRSVEIRPAGCESSIEVNLDQVVECAAWARPRQAMVIAIEKLHRQRLGEGER